MKWRLLTIVAMFAMIAGLTVRGGVAAQDLPTDSATPDFSELDGIQDAVARNYEGDISALYSTDLSSGATPDFSSVGTFSIISLIIRFEDDDKASDAFDQVNETITQQVSGESETFGDLEEVDVDDFGDNTSAQAGSFDAAGVTTSVFFLTTQEDEFVYYTAVVSFADADSARSTAVDFTNTVKDRDAGDGEVELHEDGTSSGGLFNKFPDASDEVLTGVTPSADVQLYPEPES